MTGKNNGQKNNNTDRKSVLINGVRNSGNLNSIKAYRINLNQNSKYVSGKKLSDTAASFNTQRHTENVGTKSIISAVSENMSDTAASKSKSIHDKKTFSYSGEKSEKKDNKDNSYSYRKNTLLSASAAVETGSKKDLFRENAKKYRFIRNVQSGKIVKSDLVAHTYRLISQNEKKRFLENSQQMLIAHRKRIYTYVHSYKGDLKKNRQDYNRANFHYDANTSTMDKIKVVDTFRIAAQTAKEATRTFDESDTAAETIGNLVQQPFRAGKRIFEKKLRERIKDEVTNRIRSSYYQNRTSSMSKSSANASKDSIKNAERKKKFAKQKSHKAAKATAKKDAAKKTAQQTAAKEAAKKEFAKAATKAAAEGGSKAAVTAAGGSMLPILGIAALIILIILVILLAIIIIMTFFWTTPHTTENVFKDGSYQEAEYKEEEEILNGYMTQIQQYFDKKQLVILKVVDMEYGGYEPAEYNYDCGNLFWDIAHVDDNYIWDLYHFDNKWIKLSDDFDLEHIIALVAVYKFKEVNAEGFDEETYKFEITNADLENILGQMRFYDASYTFYDAPCPNHKCDRFWDNGWIYICSGPHQHLAGSVTNWEPSWGYERYTQVYFWDEFFTAEEQEEYKPIYEAYYEYISDRLGITDQDGKIIEKSHTPLDDYANSSEAQERLRKMYMSGG